MMERVRGYCKYCYKTHGDWTMMDQSDYQVDGLTIIRCDKCNHTSALEATGISKKHARPWKKMEKDRA
jgi:hypothetical protein